MSERPDHPIALRYVSATLLLSLAACAGSDDGGEAGPAAAADPNGASDTDAADRAPAAREPTSEPSQTTCQADLTPRPGDDDCTSPLVPGSDRECVFDFGGASRSFLLYAPKSYDPCTPTALFFDAHGAAENKFQQAGLEPWMSFPSGVGSSFRAVADREGFIVVTAQGISDLWSPTDVDFVYAMLDMVQQVANIDPERIYHTGISNGGLLSYWVGCADRGNTFRGIAPVAGALLGACDALDRPTPLIAFHAMGDLGAPYSLGRSAVETWAGLNHCQNGPNPSMVFGGREGLPGDFCLEPGADGTGATLVGCSEDAPASTCETWDECDGGVEVVLCTVNADSQPIGGHILYLNDTYLSVAAVTWDFLQRFQ